MKELVMILIVALAIAFALTAVVGTSNAYWRQHRPVTLFYDRPDDCDATALTLPGGFATPFKPSVTVWACVPK